MATFITNVIHEVTFYVSIVTTTVSNVFHIITTVGRILCQMVYLLCSFLLAACSNLYTGLAVILTEFHLFLSDMYSTASDIERIVGIGFYSVLNVLTDILLFIQSLLTGICRLFYSFFANSGNMFVTLLMSLKHLVILVGNGTLFILQLLPYTLISLFNGLFSVVKGTVNVVHNFVLNTAGTIATMLTAFHQELTDIPPSSLFGLFLAIVLIALLRFILKSINFNSWWQQFKLKIRCYRWPRLKTSRDPTLNDSGSSLDAEPLAPSTSSSTSSRSSLLKELEREREEKLCVICQDRVKCIILLPCRHFCLCHVCMETLAQDYATCPICRREVIDHLRIYG